MTQRIGVLFPATLFVRGDMKTSILDGKLRMCQSEAGLTGGPPEFELGDMSRPLQPPVRSLNRNAAKDLYIKNVNQRLAARQKLSWPPYMIRNAGILRASQFPNLALLAVLAISSGGPGRIRTYNQQIMSLLL
jgi:hypothetical protein